MRHSDIQSGRVDLARLAEMRGGWLGAGPAQDPTSEAIDAEIAARLRACPALVADFDPRGLPRLDGVQ